MADANTAIKHTPDTFGFPDATSAEFPRLILACIAQPCNAKCPHCFLTVDFKYYQKHFGEPTEHRFMPWGAWAALVDEMASYREHTHLRVSSYGETMLHPRFLDMIRYARERGIRTSIITNGSLMTEEISRVMIEIGIESVEISAETHRQDLYEKIKVGLDFETVVKNTKTLVRLRDRSRSPLIVMVGIVNQPNANPDIERSVKYWKRRVDHVSVRHFVTWGQPGLQARGEETDPYLSSTQPCPFPFERLMYDPSGKGRLCPYDNGGKIPDFGRLGETSIQDIWHGGRHNKIKACHSGGVFDREHALTDAPLCARCEDRVNRSWTWNYLSIPKKTKPKYRHLPSWQYIKGRIQNLVGTLRRK